MDKVVNSIYGITAHSIISNLGSIANSRLKVDHPTIPSKEQAALIMSLNINQQKLLIAQSTHFLDIHLDKDALSQQLEGIQEKNTLNEMETQFLMLGAPLVLMKRLFGMHAYEFSFRRKLLNLSGKGAGRPGVCDEATEHKLWIHWQSMKGIDERQRFLKLWELTELDMHVIWSAIQPFIDKSIPNLK